VAQALVRVLRAEANARGGWYGAAGIFEPYREGGLLSILFDVQNVSHDAVMLVDAGEPQRNPRLLDRIGVRFFSGPPSGRPLTLLGPPYAEAAPVPLELSPGDPACIQLNFRMRNAELFVAGTSDTYNRTIPVRYRSGAAEQVVELDGIPVTVMLRPIVRG
jgi:hypothetical protein